MLRNLISLTIVFAIGASVSGCKSKEQKEAENAAQQAEFDKLKGKWLIVSRVADEDDEGNAPADPSIYYVVDNGMLKLVSKNNEGAEEVLEYQKMTIVPDKDVKQIDLTLCDEKGNPIQATTTKKGITGRKKKTRTTFKDVGIYKLEGDKLTLCLSYDEKKRPTDFSAPRGTGRYLLHLEKAKDGAADKKPKDANDSKIKTDDHDKKPKDAIDDKKPKDKDGDND